MRDWYGVALILGIAVVVAFYEVRKDVLEDEKIKAIVEQVTNDQCDRFVKDIKSENYSSSADYLVDRVMDCGPKYLEQVIEYVQTFKEVDDGSGYSQRRETVWQ